MRPRFFSLNTLTLTLALILAALLAACQPVELAASAAPGISVGITADLCPNVVIQPGFQVTWTNQDSREHIVRDHPGEGSGMFDSGTLRPGDSFSFTITRPGQYTYWCAADGSMTGMITVGE